MAAAPKPPAPPGQKRRFLRIGAAAGGIVVLIAVVAFLWLGGSNSVRGPSVEIALPPLKAAAPTLKPDPELVENSPEGKLPIIGRDGREPWQVYATPSHPSDHRPLIAIVISGLGLDRATTEAAVARLPAAVTLGFSPYADHLEAVVAAARQAGHEVLIDLPLEPSDYPSRDPGPETLLTSLDTATNLARLRWVMGRVTNYVGLIATMGDRFAATRTSLEPVLEVLKKRGLMYVDNGVAPTSAAGSIGRELGLAIAVADRRLDGEAGAVAVNAALTALESVAAQDGAAVGVGPVYPVTIDQVIAWAPTLAKKSLVLGPVSAVVDRRHGAAGPAP